ncbi:MAG TPA: TetR/AcrR family transcriptional regulator [Ktedonosporobacter sp.]|nr:TetR/AcrR family transcriptional regulator [Ktedonosporobacter sp.]
MDRRIRKTRQAIFEAFVGLMAEKKFEQITMNEIADRADVNRGTVYLHFVDKFDLLDQCIEAHVVQLVESCCGLETADAPSKAVLLRAFEHLEQHAFLYGTLLANKGVPAFRNRLMAVMLQILDEHIETSGLNQDMNREILVQFLASAIIGVLEWWITQKMPYPATDMVEQLWLLLERMQMMPQIMD